MTMVAVVITMTAVPIVRPIIAIVWKRPVIAIGIVVAIWVISIIARKSDPYPDRNASIRTLHRNESQ